MPFWDIWFQSVNFCYPHDSKKNLAVEKVVNFETLQSDLTRTSWRKFKGVEQDSV